MGPYRGYVVQKKGQENTVTMHHGVATCYEKRGETQPKDGRRRNATISQPTVAEITTNTKLVKKKQKSETRQVCGPCTKTRRAKPMAGTLEQNTNTTTRIVARNKNRIG